MGSLSAFAGPPPPFDSGRCAAFAQGERGRGGGRKEGNPFVPSGAPQARSRGTGVGSLSAFAGPPPPFDSGRCAAFAQGERRRGGGRKEGNPFVPSGAPQARSRGTGVEELGAFAGPPPPFDFGRCAAFAQGERGRAGGRKEGNPFVPSGAPQARSRGTGVEELGAFAGPPPPFDSGRCAAFAQGERRRAGGRKEGNPFVPSGAPQARSRGTGVEELGAFAGPPPPFDSGRCAAFAQGERGRGGGRKEGIRSCRAERRRRGVEATGVEELSAFAAPPPPFDFGRCAAFAQGERISAGTRWRSWAPSQVLRVNGSPRHPSRLCGPPVPAPTPRPPTARRRSR